MNHTLNKAIQLARLNPIRPVGRNSISRFAAVLTDGRREFFGWNSYRTHPLQARFGTNAKSVHIHAELSAIIQAIRYHGKQSGKHYSDITDLSNYDMFVARVIGNGSIGCAKPCSGCYRAIVSFGIRSVKWTE